MRGIRGVARLVRPYAARLAGALVLAVSVVCSTLLVPVLSGRAVDCALAPGRVDYAGLLGNLRLLALAVCVTSVSQWALSAVTNRVAYQVVLDLRTRAFHKLQRLPLAYLDSHRHGDLVSRVVTDAEQFANGLVMAFQQLFTGALTIILTLAFMLALDPWVTLVVVCATPLSFAAAKLIAARGFRSFHEQSERRGELTAAVEEAVSGFDVIEELDACELMEERFADANDRLAETSFHAVFLSSLVNPSTRFVNALIYAGVGVFGALLAISGGITVGGLTAFLSYATQYTKPFNDISEVVTELQNSIACADRLFELLDEEEESPDAAGTLEPEDVRGDVELDDVSFSYDKELPLIRNVRLKARPGMRVAIVGPTGCGKTTLINLLMRFYDVDAGAVRIDGTDVRDVTRASLRSCFGMVLQETWVKHATVRENIAFARPEATLEEVHAAAQAALADDFIQALPQGYDTVLDGDEASVSAGQRQLLCIARVMLADPPMLILDEATSNIDTRTELRVQRAFERLMEGRTSFVVAHRLSTITSADLIVAMRDGAVVERGTHEELLAADGFYASLYRSQFEA